MKGHSATLVAEQMSTMSTARLGAVLLMLLIASVGTDAVRYYATGNSTDEREWFEEQGVEFGDPAAPAFLVSGVADESATNGMELPGDDPVGIGQEDVRWPSVGTRNGTRFGGSLGGLAVFGVSGGPLDVGSREAATLTFFLRAHNATSEGLIFAVVENAWERNATHPIADTLGAALRDGNWSAATESSLGVYVAVFLRDGGLVEYASRASASGGATVVLRGGGGGGLSDGTWHHVAVTIDVDALLIQLFVDGGTSYSSADWLRCLPGAPAGVPAGGSRGVLGRYANASQTMVLSGGAAVFGYGFSPGPGVSLALFQVHGRVMTQAEIVALSGISDHLNVKPTVGYSFGAILAVLCAGTASFIAYTTFAELGSEAEPEEKVTAAHLQLSGDSAGTRTNWEDNAPTAKMGLGEALAESGGVAGSGTTGTSLGAAVVSLSQMRSIGAGGGGADNVAVVQKLAAIVPIAVAPLQGLSLYFSGWKWPKEFVAVMERVALFFTIDLPLVFPTVPPYMFLLLKAVVFGALVVLVVRYVMKEDKEKFEVAIRRHRATQDLYRESVRVIVCKALKLPAEDAFAVELSQLIAASMQTEWNAESLGHLAHGLSAEISAALAKQLRRIRPPEDVYEAALRCFAVSHGKLSDAEASAVLSHAHEIARVLVGSGRDAAWDKAVKILGGVELSGEAGSALCERLLLAGGAVAGVCEALGDAGPVREWVRAYCAEHRLDPAADDTETERILRSHALPAITRSVVLAPGCSVPRAGYRLELESESTPAVFTVRDGAGLDALRRAANCVCRFRALKKSFAVPVVETTDGQAMKDCRVEIVWGEEGRPVKLRMLAGSPGENREEFTLRVRSQRRMVCPLHERWLIEASPEHFRTRTLEPVATMPYRCAHSSNESFKVCEAILRGEVLRPCVNDVLFVCPDPSCRYTLCGQCARLGFVDGVKTSLVTAWEQIDLNGLLVLVLLALLFPITKDAVMVLSCHPSVRCQLGVGEGGGCYSGGATASFIAAAVIAVLTLVVFRFGLLAWMLVTLRGRQERLRGAIRTRWKGALHPEWEQFLRTDGSVLSSVYRKYELSYFLSEQPWLLAVQLGDCLAVALAPPESARQLIAVSAVELGSLVYLIATDPFIDVYHDLLAKAAALHQLLQLGLMFFHRALEAESPTGTSGKVVAAMLVVAAAYVVFFAFVLWKRVLEPFLASKAEDDVEALLRQQRLLLEMPDAHQSGPLMAELAGKFRTDLGATHFLTAVAEAHVFALSDGTEPESRERCLRALCEIDTEDPLGIRWRPLSQIDPHARGHLGKVLTSAHSSGDGAGVRKALDGATKRLSEVLCECRVQHDSSFAAGNVLSVLTSTGTVPRERDFSALTIRGADLSRAVLEEVSFAGSSISDTTMRGTVFLRADYCGARLHNVDIGMKRPPPKSPKLQLKGHTGYVSSATYSPDGTRIVSSSKDRSLRIWDASTGQSLAELTGHTHFVNSASYSPDGTRIVSASSDGSLRIWDASTGQSLAELKGHTDYVTSASYSPDGARIVSASQDRSLRIWDASTGQSLAGLKKHTSIVNSVSYSPDGTRIVSASDDKILRIWDASTGQLLAELTGHTDVVNSALYSPDGTRIVSSSSDRSLRIWEASTGQSLAELKCHSNVISSASYSPDATRIVSSSQDSSLRIWDASTGQSLAELKGHMNVVNSASYSPDATRIVSASDDKILRIWDASTGRSLAELTGHTGVVNSASYSPNGTRIVSSSKDKTSRIWDASTGQSLTELKGHTDELSSASYSPDGTRVVSSSHDSSLRIWDAFTGQSLAELKGHTDCVTSASYSPDGTRIVSSSSDRSLRIWDASTGESLAELTGHTHFVNSASYSPDGTRIVSSSNDRSLRIWEASTGLLLAELKGHTNVISSASYSPDGTRIVSSSHDKVLRIWDASTGQSLAEPRCVVCAKTSKDEVTEPTASDRCAKCSSSYLFFVRRSADGEATVRAAKCGAPLHVFGDVVWSSDSPCFFFECLSDDPSVLDLSK